MYKSTFVKIPELHTYSRSYYLSFLTSLHVYIMQAESCRDKVKDMMVRLATSGNAYMGSMVQVKSYSSGGGDSVQAKETS